MDTGKHQYSLTVPSKRRTPLLADFFHRLKLMERRGSGMKKIIGEYKRFENLENYHAPEFRSNATEFHVTLWNLNYRVDVVKDNLHVVKEVNNVVKEVVKSFSFLVNFAPFCYDLLIRLSCKMP